MISKLKIECGFNTVSKLTRMFIDMEQSKEVMKFYRGDAKDKIVNGIVVNCDILTAGIWPEQNTHPLILPVQLKACESNFEAFYKSKHSGKHLQWLHSACTVTIQTKCFDKQYAFTTSLYQTAILCLFNDFPVLTIKQIEEKTNLPLPVLEEQLKYLFNPKQTVLLKDNAKSPKITPDEQVRVNDKFSNPSLIHKFVPRKNVVKSDPNQKGDLEKQIDKELAMERGFTLEAMIVRIMKARINENHNNLVAEVIRQVNLFKPAPSMIKEAIERLIEKEYLERDAANRSTYKYIP